MQRAPFVVVTDRGGHLHNALMLLKQLPLLPDAIVTTEGPDIEALKKDFSNVYTVPYLFQWIGKKRFFNPFRLIHQLWVGFELAKTLRPSKVVSVGASNVVIFCYWARIFGAEIIHIECMNQVQSPSITGQILYPICSALYVQWEDLLKKYGPKALYRGWVL